MLYIYIYIYVYIHTYIHIHIHTHTYMYSVQPISILRFWISEGLTQAESYLKGVEFSCP